MVDAVIKTPAKKTDTEKLTQEERLAKILANKSLERVRLGVNEKGQILIDKEKHPDLYEWAVNG